MNKKNFAFWFLLTVPALSYSASDDLISFEDIKKNYDAIKKPSFDSGKVVETDSLVLNRDVGHFIFESGAIYFSEPVSGRVMSGFFKGKGVFKLITDEGIEKQQIRRFCNKDTVEQKFEQAILFFTDSTYEEISKLGNPITQNIDGNILKDAKKFKEEISKGSSIDARFISDLPGYGYFFQSYLDCPKDKKFIFTIDPYRVEEVNFVRYKRVRHTKFTAFESWYSGHVKPDVSKYRPLFDAKLISIDATIDNKEFLKSETELEFINFVEGTRFLPVCLAPSLHIEKITNDKGDSCLFFQEKEDATLWVVFPEVLKKDSTYKLRFIYSGKDIVKDIGSGNFAVEERKGWYPKFYLDAYHYDPVHFVMKIGVPKGMTLLGTGKLVKRWDEGDFSYSNWDSEIEYKVAGFNYGKFSVATQESPLCTINCYTNTYLGGALSGLQQLLKRSDLAKEELMMFPQELNPDGICKNAAIQSRNAYEVYAHFFGAIPLKEVKVSQQPQESFGQSWPTLIFLPYTSFFNESVKDKLGLLESKSGQFFYETVAAHEMSHQWWGHTVFTNSYHDVWLGEGFATYSAGLYAQTAEGIPQFKDYLKKLKGDILEKIEKGKRATDVGPVCLGTRLLSIDSPGAYNLVYSKGAYILHMLRMMLFNYETKSDDRFIAMMKDYINTYSGRGVCTEDFKEIVDKHFDEDMSWFFNQWVYGTEVPVYKFNYKSEVSDDGKYLLTVTVEQKGVSPSFKMPLAMIINFENGYNVGHIFVTGNKPVSKQFKLPEKPKSVDLNPWEGVLCEIK